MNKIKNIDNEHIQYICKQLKLYRASVLVGAGFSLNAEKRTPSTKSFPLWRELGEIFAQKLYLDASVYNSNKYRDPTILAEELEAVFGRSELDKTIIDAIPDEQYLPSSVHIKLLKIRWVDIFTTNYDTLLERASEMIPNKSFNLVTTKEDLIGSGDLPRIVKLHGSLPSTRPFIITSEDYRNYPQKFSPFVNTVQQSLLENTVCMIGFSGDDPNFKKWIGWIRDNLNQNAPYIYLITHNPPPSAHIKLLNKKNVMVVDISSFGTPDNPKTQYEEFFNYILENVTDNDNNVLNIEKEFLIAQYFHDMSQRYAIIEMHTNVFKQHLYKYEYTDSSFSDLYKASLNYIKTIEHQNKAMMRGIYNNTDLNLKTFEIKKEYFNIYNNILKQLYEFYDYPNNDTLEANLIKPYKFYLSDVHNLDKENQFINSDPILLERCINNLLRKTIEYSFHGTNIYIELSYDFECVFIKITHFASLINFQETVFANETSKRYLRNTELEFNFIVSIIEKLDGEIWGESQEICKYDVSLLNFIIEYKNEEYYNEIYKTLLITYHDLDDSYLNLKSKNIENNVVAIENKKNSIIEEIVNRNYMKKYINISPTFFKLGIKNPIAKTTYTIKIPKK